MSRIGKLELIEKVTEKVNEEIVITKKDTGLCVNAVIDTIFDTLKNGDDIVIPGFGSFKVQDVKARKGRNIATGETIKIPAHKKVKFAAGKTLAEAVNTKKKGKKK